MTTRALLITANVGSIFEDPEVLLKIWIKEFLDTVSQYSPEFVALHCQEVGGKHFERSMRYVEDFVRTLLASEQLMQFSSVRIFLDEDFVDVEKFTALGSFYFISQNITKDVQIWDFTDETYVGVLGKDIHSGNIEKVSIKEKSKFPQNFFPECKWSRKGFMRTRWLIKGVALDLINIHLFHDVNNILSNSEFPSIYAQNRSNAFEYTLQQIETKDSIPYFVFGDFNFRLDNRAVIEKLTNKLNPILVKKCNEIEKMLFRDEENQNQIVLTIEKKLFDYHNKQWFGHNTKALLSFDKELEPFRDRLFEFDIDFPPSYPFQEDASSAEEYMTTRCPAWCDRILMNQSAKRVLLNDLNHSQVKYAMMGSTIPMGDHKPIFLSIELPNEKLLSVKGNELNDLIRDPQCTAWPALHDPVLAPKMHAFRTHSIPTFTYKSSSSGSHERARRSTSAFTAVIHSNDFYLKTEELFRSLQNKPISKRLTSHHSSSDEDWYSEFAENKTRDEKRRVSEESPSQSTPSTHVSVHDIRDRHCFCAIF